MATTRTKARRATCQVCGGNYGVAAGVLAHHGYRRPGHGWQTASCFGARFVEFEVSRDRLGEWIERVKKQRAITIERIAVLAACPADLSLRFVTRGAWDFSMGRRAEDTVEYATAETFASTTYHHKHRAPIGTVESGPKWEHEVELEIKREEQQVGLMDEEITRQQARYDAWQANTEETAK